jgi:hypothetical protein
MNPPELKLILTHHRHLTATTKKNTAASHDTQLHTQNQTRDTEMWILVYMGGTLAHHNIGYRQRRKERVPVGTYSTEN